MPFTKGRGKGRRRGFCGQKWQQWFGRPETPVYCLCPSCGCTVSHEPGVPCFQKACPKCGSPMTRKFFSE
ncbi:MAG: hypothetical protein JW832_15220 [Deltaproteobacteria bacterium]|nr:hypothetical protein [Deltaproteobacteria bacterium]